MLPVIAIVGRPNVGKSTLFNCLSGSRDALVADEPGLTRDRHYRVCTLGHRRCVVVDTGGLSEDGDQMSMLVTAQTLRAHQDADVTFFVVDARDGLTAADEIFAARLRRVETRILLVVNKTEGLEPATALSEFHRLGLGDPWPVAAAHGRGVHRIVEAAAEYFATDQDDEDEAESGIKVAIVGRPNVGKSTLVNRILGEERVVAHDMPGTTRDSIHVPFERFGRRYTLIDTAGIRRRARVSDKIEKFSILKSLQSIEAANVVVLMLDAREGVTDQDASLLGMVVDSGRALLVALNKWDNLTLDQRRQARASLERKLAFVDFASIHFISALHGSGVGKLFDTIDRAWESASRDLSTSVLTRILIDAIESHAPPLVRGRRIKLRYAHQGGRNPPCIVVHGNQTHAVPDAYRRYLVHTFRRALKLKGTPIRVEFKTGENPYKGRKSVLSDRQRRKRKRLIRHVRGG